jgi:hypothetical protein
VWFAVLMTLTPMHPVHTSMAEVEVVAGRLEVSLRVRTADFDRALEKAPGVEKAGDQRVLALLGRSFLVKSQRSQKLRLIGVEAAGSSTWIYFEVPLIGPLKDYRLRHTLFFDLEPSQVHRVNLKVGAEVRTLVFSRSQPEHPLVKP